jgi:hypothetical protein
MKRKLLIGSVLTAALLFTALTERPTEAYSCPYYNFCVDTYKDCMASCNGDPTCEYLCKDDYTWCQCTNCNLCPRDPSQAQAARGAAGSADNSVTVNGAASASARF